MKVVLLENVPNLGQIGDIKEVKDGYARNYLIPKGLAAQATKSNLKRLQHQLEAKKKKAERVFQNAVQMKEALEKTEVIITAPAGESDRLFGSVTNADIAEALVKQGFDVDKRKVLLESPIKTLGEYEVEIKLHEGVSAKVRVKVERE